MLSEFDPYQVTDNEYFREEVDYGVASSILKAVPKNPAENDKVFAIKVSTANRRFSKEPHDIVKEILVLQKLKHPNIIPLSRFELLPALQTWQYWMPWISLELNDLLNYPLFMPRPPPANIVHLLPPGDYVDAEEWEAVFEVVAKSMIYQILLALNYLHNLPAPIAHRDIKPGNVLLTFTGRVQLIDFGIAYVDGLASEKLIGHKPLWSEDPSEMKIDVGTGSFRAPELFYGPSTYDAVATDLWSMGATIAHFFTAVEVKRYDDNEEFDNVVHNKKLNPQLEKIIHDVNSPVPSLIIPEDFDAINNENCLWPRQPLFDHSRGDLAMIWEFCKIRGTPNKDNWPTFSDLPHASFFPLRQVDPISLANRLPNLPSSSPPLPATHRPPDEPTPSVLDLMQRFLVYPPASRIRVTDALKHPWFNTSNVPVVVPVDLPAADCGPARFERRWRGESLAKWLRSMLLEQFEDE